MFSILQLDLHSFLSSIWIVLFKTLVFVNPQKCGCVFFFAFQEMEENIKLF